MQDAEVTLQCFDPILHTTAETPQKSLQSCFLEHALAPHVLATAVYANAFTCYVSRQV